MSFSVQLLPVESPQVGFPNTRSKISYKLIEPQPLCCTCNSLRLPIQCTFNPPTSQIYSTSCWICIWNLVGGLQKSFFCGNSQRVKTVGYFRRGATMLMFDRILNLPLFEEVCITGVTQGNLELSLPPDSLDEH